MFVLFIVETSQILSLATAFGFAKEVLMIKTVYSTLIKNNPLGQIAASEFKEKKEDKNASSK
ncbi:hypothetical protein I4L69_001638 [Enterococcus faecium]|nr:hypothetical protein [Enterococcus faecium]